MPRNCIATSCALGGGAAESYIKDGFHDVHALPSATTTAPQTQTIITI